MDFSFKREKSKDLVKDLVNILPPPLELLNTTSSPAGAEVNTLVSH